MNNIRPISLDYSSGRLLHLECLTFWYCNKGARVTGRINARLLELARARAGAMSDSQLLEFALANIVIEDGFADAFMAARGKVDPGLDLEA